VRDGDRIVLDAAKGTLELMVDPSELARRPRDMTPASGHGWGRELFAPFRAVAGDAEIGGGIFSAYAGTAV
jgi:phosphogluconate dehydratase